MFVDAVKAQGFEDVYVISAAARIGVNELLDKMTELVTKLPPVILHEALEEEEKIYRFEKEEQFRIEVTDGVFEITGSWARVTMDSTNFEDPESLSYFQRSMINAGVIEALREAGIQEGDTVKIGDWEFDFIE